MQSTGSAVSASSIALLGLLTLATAMGIGRFAFTPLLPLMQKEYGVTLAQGAWLATANYFGYFVGAAVSFALVPKPGAAVRYALVVVAATTAAMAVAESHWLWIGLRFAAGVASAFALIGASAWMLNRLSTLGRSDMSGWVFSGVGVGIVLAGGVALVTARFPHAATTAWLLLGGSAALVAVLGWPRLTDAGMVPQATRVDDGSRPLRSAEWWLIVCYGAFGFGYIIPATFIPAMASKIVDNPWMFGWAWPFFGAAAAASTVVVTRHFQNTPPRTVATWSLLIMAVGVLLPAITRSIAMIIAASLCVGGTFMVMTIAGFQEARRLSSAPPARLIAAMTAAFAIGQLIGPMLVGIGSQGDAVAVPSFVACAVLIASAIALRYGPRR